MERLNYHRANKYKTPEKTYVLVAQVQKTAFQELLYGL